ncbi:MAG: hypothetical protein ABIJ00_04320 [Candidatus Eisenbacteria bacterium]
MSRASALTRTIRVRLDWMSARNCSPSERSGYEMVVVCPALHQPYCDR